MAAYSHYQSSSFDSDTVFWSNLNHIQPDQLTKEYSVDTSEKQSIVNESVVKQSNAYSSISMVGNKSGSNGKVSQSLCGIDRKRKLNNGSSSVTATEETKQVNCKKIKGGKEVKKDVKKDKKRKDKNQANYEEPPKGYIHVRARRGQATDSHSLAERVRREKISERMKMLQALVPGCDKVTGKALMLDEIINYVQSLQNQVEFLSLKLASLDATVHTFGLMDIESLTFGLEGMNNNDLALPMLQQMPCTTLCGTNNGDTQPFDLPTGIMPPATAAAAVTPLSYPFVDTSTNVLQLEQKPNVLPLQDGSSSYWGVLDDQQQQRQSNIINQLCFTSNNLCSYFY